MESGSAINVSWAESLITPGMLVCSFSYRRKNSRRYNFAKQNAYTQPNYCAQEYGLIVILVIELRMSAREFGRTRRADESACR